MLSKQYHCDSWNVVPDYDTNNPKQKYKIFVMPGGTGPAMSMDAKENPCELLTRPVQFSGKCLFVNANIARGELRAEIVDELDQPIKPFTLENSRPLGQDSTIQQITWKGNGDLSSLKNRPVRIRFRMTSGSLYAFWVSRDASGRSDGYVAAGGPGYSGPIDTVGKRALQAK